ncbi:MAG: glycoside hydrolase family 3 protein [Candidatus Dormibacteraeota bacterium]|nr:glycoside hydrolase family 3 protein [Candidatus Dormibacteraeota bacterium]
MCARRLGAVVTVLLAAVACGQGGGPVPRPGPVPSSPRALPPALTSHQADLVYGRMTDEQRVGQLFMVGESSAGPGPAAVATALTTYHVGGVTLYGTGWSSRDKVRSTIQALQAMAAPASGGARLYVAGNQEGGRHGSLQAFYGPGFEDLPAAVDQGQMAPSSLQYSALAWGQELVAAGVNLDLAPVMDTVPPGADVWNEPVGELHREFGHDPWTVASHGSAFVRGMEAAGESVAIKHFPGLGRVGGNTDFSSNGVTDPLTSAGDGYLQPFEAGWRAGAQMVMVSLATYPRIDPANPAVFSSALITGLLRGQMRFPGPVISDDLGDAAAVQGVAPGDRATRFLRAGGDIVLTQQPTDIAPMTAAVLALMGRDPAFRVQVAASVHRVLRAKLMAGLIPPG